VKKTRSSANLKAPVTTKIDKALVPGYESIISIKIIDPSEQAKKPNPIKTPQARQEEFVLTKPALPKEEPKKHEIKQSKLSVEEDIITNPRDYETQTFDFDLECTHNHFFPEGSTLPVSKGKAYCPICGERLGKPETKKKPRYHEF